MRLCINPKLFLLLTVLIFKVSFCQKQSIEKIQLSDTILVNTIKDYIIKRKQNYDKFKKLGYIDLEMLYFNKQTRKDQLEFKFTIVDEYYRPRKNRFPRYYCYIEDKLILMYDVLSHSFLEPMHSKKNQRKLIRIMKPFFEKSIHLKVKDNDGNIIINDKNFVDEQYNIHGGITLSIFDNGKFTIEQARKDKGLNCN